MSKYYETTKLAGSMYHNSQEYLAKLSELPTDTEQFRFVHEAKNLYDSNAVAVFGTYHFPRKYGYVAATEAEVIAKALDKHRKITVIGYEVTGGQRTAHKVYNYGLILHLEITY